MNPVMARSTEGAARRSTIIDVAREAGVSIKTVSRVVRLEPNVRPETREKVQAVMDRLNYRPTLSARSSVSSRSFLIGLVFDNPNPAYTFDLLRGAQESARANGYHLVVEPIDGSNGHAGQQIIELAVQSNLDGLIVPPPLCDKADVIEVLGDLGRSFARIAPSVEMANGFAVSMDDHAAAAAMTQHLIRLGHQRIGFITGRAGTATTRKRLEGYRTAMAEAGIEVPEGWIVQGNFSLRSGLEMGEMLLRTQPSLSAVFASNDDMAAGVLMAAHKLGRDVPGDLSVAGFDDSVTASAMWPPLTTIRQPVFEMAALAAKRIIEHQRHRDSPMPPNERLDFELIERGSTGPAPAA